MLVTNNPNVIVDYNKKLDLEWEYLRQKALEPLEIFLTTGNKAVMYSKKEYMDIYTKVYNLCIQ